jgi:hypothetical protein
MMSIVINMYKEIFEKILFLKIWMRRKVISWRVLFIIIVVWASV